MENEKEIMFLTSNPNNGFIRDLRAIGYKVKVEALDFYDPPAAEPSLRSHRGNLYEGGKNVALFVMCEEQKYTERIPLS
jgi:hypothetical protein